MREGHRPLGGAGWPREYLRGCGQYLAVRGHHRTGAAVYGGGKANASGSATNAYRVPELAALMAWQAYKTAIAAAWGVVPIGWLFSMHAWHVGPGLHHSSHTSIVHPLPSSACASTDRVSSFVNKKEGRDL